MADPYEEYVKANLMSDRRLPTGSSRLGGLFDLEGPEAGGQFVNIPGARFNPGARMNAMMELGEILDPDTLEYISQRTMDDNFSIPVEGLVPDEGGFFTGGGALTTPSGGQFSIGDEDLAGMAAAYRDIQDNAIDPELNRFPSGPRGMSLSKAAFLEGQVADSDLAAREMLGEEAAFEGSVLDEIASSRASLDNTENVQVTAGEVDSIDNLIAESAIASSDQAIDRKMNADNTTVTQEQADEGFLAAMDDFFEAARGAGPEVPEERTIEEYKRAFSEATGIDTSGKVDKKDALMAFGLALMQNKAGKGFNVGKMLTSVGEAGDKAMPALQRAKTLAREGALAGGRYALQTQATDEAKRTAGAEAAMNRSQYWVYERGEPGAEFASFDKGQFVPLSQYELNKLINDPAFESQYEFISAADRMDVLAKRGEGQDLGDQWGSKYEPVSLIGGKWEDQPAALVVNAVAANPNYGGTTPTNYQLGEDAEGVVNRFIGYQEGIYRDQANFQELIANIEAGVSIPGQALDKVTGFFRAIGYTPAGGMPSNTAQARQALANFSIDNATDILKESGKTLSDSDRNLVNERVGKIDFFNNDSVLILNQVQDIYDFTVTQAQKNLDTAVSNLEKNFGISISSGQNSDMPTQAELDAINQRREANGLNPRRMEDYQ